MTTVYSAEVPAAVVAELGESPLWDPDVGVRWLDVPGRRLLTLADCRLDAVSLPETVTAIELTDGPRLLAVVATGFASLNPAGGDILRIATTLDDSAISMNDGAIDPRGRCWAGSAVRDDSRRGRLFRLEGGRISAHADGIGMSNGIDWSPDGTVLYHADSTAGTVTAWQYDVESGKLGEPRVLCTVPGEVGLPDGLTVDAEGFVWLAIWGAGQVRRLDPMSGDTVAVVEVPTPYTTSCVFGGPGLSTLYVTTANYQEPAGGGLLYAAELPHRGQEPRRFVGGL